jgi:hypothetical protein
MNDFSGVKMRPVRAEEAETMFQESTPTSTPEGRSGKTGATKAPYKKRSNPDTRRD